MYILRKFRQMELFAATFEKTAPKAKTRRAESRRRTLRLAVSALVAALSAAVMFFGVTLGVLDLSALAIASFASAFCVMEMGGAYPYLVWLVTSALAFFILPDKLVFFEYLLFAGVYPMIKFRAARIENAVVRWAIKLCAFNVALAAVGLISMYLLALDAETGLSLGWIVFAVGNAAFVVFDLALSSVCAFYVLRLRRAIGADKI